MILFDLITKDILDEIPELSVVLPRHMRFGLYFHMLRAAIFQLIKLV